MHRGFPVSLMGTATLSNGIIRGVLAKGKENITNLAWISPMGPGIKPFLQEAFGIYYFLTVSVNFFHRPPTDGFVKSLKTLFFVISAEAGIK